MCVGVGADGRKGSALLYIKLDVYCFSAFNCKYKQNIQGQCYLTWGNSLAFWRSVSPLSTQMFFAGLCMLCSWGLVTLLPSWEVCVSFCTFISTNCKRRALILFFSSKQLQSQSPPCTACTGVAPLQIPVTSTALRWMYTSAKGDRNLVQYI